MQTEVANVQAKTKYVSRREQISYPDNTTPWTIIEQIKALDNNFGTWQEIVQVWKTMGT